MPETAAAPTPLTHSEHQALLCELTRLEHIRREKGFEWHHACVEVEETYHGNVQAQDDYLDELNTDISDLDSRLLEIKRALLATNVADLIPQQPRTAAVLNEASLRAPWLEALIKRLFDADDAESRIGCCREAICDQVEREGLSADLALRAYKQQLRSSILPREWLFAALGMLLLALISEIISKLLDLL